MDKVLPLPVVVAVCGDPGGANAVTPVLQALQASSQVQVRAFAYREARNLWSRHGVAFEPLPDNLTIAEAGQRLCNSCAQLLLAGTSYNSVDLEKRFIAAARERNVPSLVVLDFWSNYLTRFQDADGRLSFVPDKIAVMDQFAYDEMVALGINPNCLVVTGQPAFDELIAWRQRVTSERRQSNRHELNVTNGEKLVLFASQPLRAVFGSSPEHPLYMGYDEVGVIKALLTALEDIAARRLEKITLLLRPHPRETTCWPDLLHSELVRILVSSAMDRRDQAIAADLVAGMNSEMLVETCYLGCPTVSLQPGLCFRDSLPTNRSGLSRAVYTFAEIQPALEEMLFDKIAYQTMQTKLDAHPLDDGASHRVVRLVQQMISESLRRVP